MPRKCTVCEHEKVEEINKALLEGVSLRDLAGRYSVSKTALHRHKESHLPAELTKAREAQEVTKADSLLDQVIELRDKALSILAKAERAGELRTALQGVREAKGCLELLARLQGELQERTTVNVLVNPQWITLRTVILRTLEPYPEARLKLVQALKEAEDNAVN
jgi:transposase-like protein